MAMRYPAFLFVIGAGLLALFHRYEGATVMALQAIALAIMSNSKPEDGEA